MIVDKELCLTVEKRDNAKEEEEASDEAIALATTL
jgi:hypothetical protein